MIYCGIDPGLDGAAAFLFPDGKRVEFYDTPTVQIGRKRDYDLPGMADILRRLNDLDTSVPQILVGLEKVHSMPGQGVTSMFSFGGGFRAWEAMLVYATLPYELVPPQRWKKALLDGMPKDKDSSRVVARRLFPQCANDLKLKRHHGRSDALLIAHYLKEGKL